MDNYEKIKSHLLDASELLIPKHQAAIVKMVEDGEESGVDQKIILRNLLSHMHLVLVHNK